MLHVCQYLAGQFRLVVSVWSTNTVDISGQSIALLSRSVAKDQNPSRSALTSTEMDDYSIIVYISTLGLILMALCAIVATIHCLWSNTFATDLQYNYLYYILYHFIHELMPFVIVSSLPTMHKDISRWIHRLRNINDGEESILQWQPRFIPMNGCSSRTLIVIQSLSQNIDLSNKEMTQSCCMAAFLSPILLCEGGKIVRMC